MAHDEHIALLIITNVQRRKSRKGLTVQFFTNTKDFLHIPRHYLMDLIEFIIQLSNISLRTSVLVQFLRFLYESIYTRKKRVRNLGVYVSMILNEYRREAPLHITKFNKGIGSSSCLNVRPVDTFKLILEIFKVLEREFLGVRAVTHCQVANTSFYDITKVL